MKPFFGIDITTDKKNETQNADQFLVQKPSAAAEKKNSMFFDDAFDAFKDAMKAEDKKTNLFVCAGMAGLFSLVFFLICVVARWQNGPNPDGWWWALAIGLGCAALAAVLAALGWRCGKYEAKWDDLENETDRVEDSITEIYRELGVPQSAKSVEALGFFYRVKNGELRPCKAEWDQSQLYYGYTFKGYVRGGRLCLACLDGVFALPRNEIKAIRTIRKRIVLPMWAKDEPITGEKFKPYQLKEDEYGNVCAKWYHVLEFEHDGEAWGIWFPNYELPAYEKLTGLKADAQNKPCKDLFTLKTGD
ncbi:MAG: phage holin family protein [Clostridia bacterium]|nr:phage holin family protein [Clostridia bacterium]